jgi:RNA polymerase sigma-70 factor (ECF subfamily)
MEWTDQEAAQRASTGDQSAFRLLVERHSHALFRLAFRMSGNEQDAEDLVQETFLRAYKQLPKFDGRSAFGTWLYRICVNCSLDSLRARKQRREQQGPEHGDDGMHYWLEQVAAREPSPERLLHSREIASLLRPALEKLSETERSAFILRHYEGCGIEQIAEVLGVQTGAAKHSVFRAVQKLRRALQPVWEVEAR